MWLVSTLALRKLESLLSKISNFLMENQLYERIEVFVDESGYFNLNSTYSP